MPGRRFPPQSPEARGAQHRRAAFEGALDGMSYLPSPIKQNPPGTVHGRYLMQFGQDEKVVTSWGRQEVPLSNKATPYSEHVFVCGPLYGRALREGVEWERYSDFQGVAVLDTAGVQPGEVIVVEYARFGGGSAISDVCTQTYPSIVTPEASALTYLSQPGTYLPPPDGFPTRLVNEDYDDPGTWFAAWFVSYGGISGTQLATTAVPGIAPGSAYARETRRTTTGRIPGVAHDIILYSGDLRPRWSQATRVGGESWFRQDLALPTEFESDFIQYIYWYTASGRYRVWTSVGYHHKDHNWYVEMNRTAHPVEGGGTRFRHALTGWTGIPHDGDVHRMGYDIDCASQTITAFFDSQKFTYTGPEVWPSGEALAWEVYAEEERSDWVGYAFESAIGAQTAKALVTDGHTIRTDVPYCKWKNPPVCSNAPKYPVIALPDAATITMLDPGFYDPDRMSYSPTATGMPASLTAAGAEFQGGFATNDNIHIIENLLHVGPPIAPGYAHSWESGPVSDKTQHSHGLSVWGGATEPRLMEATYLRWSSWVMLVNYKKARPQDPTGGSAHDVSLTLWTRFTSYTFKYNPHTSEWRMNASVLQWDANDGSFSLVPVSVTVDPYDGAAHKYEIAIDTVARKVTFKADSQSWSMTDPLMWPYGSYWDAYPMLTPSQRGDDEAISGGMFTGSYGSIGGGVYPTLRTCGATIETDAPWCTWG